MAGRPAAPAGLLAVLSEAQVQGFIGRGPLEPHVRHADGYVAVARLEPRRAVDLGSGGGLPGLVLAWRWPASEWLLIEANQRRAAFLREAVEHLGLGDRVGVDDRRAEAVGRDPARRGVAELVVARAFGRPAVVAECAAPLLRVGGLLVVSEPPTGPDRWDREALATLGLRWAAAPGDGLARMEQETLCPERFPRRVGVPAKRPLF